MLQAVIFDIDGTLLNSVDQHAQAWVEAFQHFDLEFPFDCVRTQIGKGGDKLLEVFLSPEQIEQIGKPVEKYRKDIFQSKFLATCQPFPQVRELFEHLRGRHLKIALGSSAKEDELKKYTKLLNIEDLVDAAVSSDDVERSKPDPDAVTAAREKLGGLPPEVCRFVGDSPFDATAAATDHTHMVGVLCGGFPEADLRAAGASEIFRDPADLLARWTPWNN